MLYYNFMVINLSYCITPTSPPPTTIGYPLVFNKMIEMCTRQPHVQHYVVLFLSVLSSIIEDTIIFNLFHYKWKSQRDGHRKWDGGESRNGWKLEVSPRLQTIIC